MTRKDNIARLEEILANAEARYAKVEARVLAAREAGVDTSKAARATPGTTPDFALRKAAGRVAQARKNLDAYKEAR